MDLTNILRFKIKVTMSNMVFPNIPLSKEIFLNCQWQDAVNQSQKKQVECYSQCFWSKSQEYETSGNTEFQIALALLAGATFPMLKPESLNTPFSYMEFIDNISNEHLNILQEWVWEIPDNELKARIADIIWIRKRDYRIVPIAIDAYLESAKFLEDSQEWSPFIERLERAIRLSRQTNQQTYFTKVVIYIKSLLDKYNGEDPLWASAKLMELLREFNYKEEYSLKYAPLAEKAANRAETEHNFHLARGYWEVAIGWYRKAKNFNKERSASLAYAETYVKEAEDHINQTSPSYFTASHFLIKAIEAFTNIGGSQIRIETIHKLLLDYQYNSTTEFQQFSQRIDISIIAGEIIDKITGKSLDDALFNLAVGLIKSPPVSEIEKQTKELIERSVFRQFFPAVYINESGKRVGHSPSKDDEMYKIAIFYQQINVQAIIEPARYQINLEHHVKVSDFYRIVVDNPFVPRGREEIYARGLYAGLTGDFLVATHLLIPQIEHSLRCLVKRQGNITSWLDKGIQDEHIMSVLFTKHKSSLEEIFGQDITFDLIGLLNCKEFGSNLRNLMTHGLISSNGFNYPPVIYLWWLTLHLCYLLLIQKNQ